MYLMRTKINFNQLLIRVFNENKYFLIHVKIIRMTLIAKQVV